MDIKINKTDNKGRLSGFAPGQNYEIRQYDGGLYVVPVSPMDAVFHKMAISVQAALDARTQESSPIVC